MPDEEVYQPPVASLLTLGRPSGSWPNYRDLGLTEADVPELVRMAGDPALNGADGESLEVWAPLHAWRALGQLQAAAAAEPLVSLLSELDDSDWFREELPEVMALIGPPAIPPLAAYLADGSHDLWPRITAATALQQIVVAHPAARAEAIAPLVGQLERFADNDETLNGSLILSLAELNEVAAAPLMERAFAADRVDQSIMGDWEEVQIALGLLSERITPRPRFFPLSLPDLAHPAAGTEASTRHRQAENKAKTKRKAAQESRRRNKNRK